MINNKKRSRKGILQQVLKYIHGRIEENITYIEEGKKDASRLSFGICHLVSLIVQVHWYEYYEKPHSLTKIFGEIKKILEDIQKVNNIRFNEDEYFAPFCSIPRDDVSTVEHLKEWYKKRIEAIEKTIEYYNQY